MQIRSYRRWLVTLNLLVLFILPPASPDVMATMASQAHINPHLRAMAIENPNEIVSVIVQKVVADERPEQMVAQFGGKVTQSLHVINAFAAELTAGNVLKLAQTNTIRWISLNAPIYKSVNTVGDLTTSSDDFNAVTYANGITTMAWAGPWQEIGETDGPETGDVAITRFFGGAMQGLRLQRGDRGIQRHVDLGTVDQTTLTFTYRRKDFATAADAVAVQISANGGITWTELNRLAGPASDAEMQFASYDISAYTSEQTMLRLLTTPTLSDRARFYVDKLEIHYTERAVDTTQFSHNVFLPLISTEANTTIDTEPIERKVDIAHLARNGGNMTVRDEFGAISFNGNDGTQTWSNDWQEMNEYDGPSNGRIRAYSSSRCASGSCLRIGGDEVSLNNRGILREVNLSGASFATLSFSYRRYESDDEGGSIRVQVSGNGGANWITLATYYLSTSDSSHITQSFDISSYIAANAQIRFLGSGSEVEGYFYFDNIQIAYDGAGSGGNNTNGGSGGGSGTTLTMRDEFDTKSYSGNNGTANWSSDWQEQNESDGPKAGRIWVPSSSRCASGKCLRIGGDYVTLNDKAITRAANLTGATSATLNFSYRRRSYYINGSVEAQVSGNGGATWTTLATYHLTGSDSSHISQSFDISSYIAANTQIRFLAAGSAVEGYFYIDNVEIVYASGNNSSGGNNDPVSATLIETNATWKYLDNGSNQGTAWRELSFNDSSWASGNGQFGYGDGDEATVISYGSYSSYKHPTTYFRHSFQLFDASSFTQLTMKLLRDDGAVVYLNGVEVVRSNMPGGTINYTTHAVNMIQGSAEDNYLTFTLDPALLVNGENVVAVEIHQLSYSNVDISFDLELTGVTTCAECIDTSGLESTHIAAIAADQVWNGEEYLQGQDIVVAVVDSGIAPHKDLEDANGNLRIIAQVDFTGGQGSIDDTYGHGTHIAGTIAGSGKQSQGKYVGVAPKAKLVDVKVTNDYGAGNMADVVAGIQWILENKDTYNIRVANLSLNSAVPESYHTSPLNAALEILWFNGVVVVVSAGNNSSEGILYPPANDPFVITAGAVDTNGTPSIWDDILALFSDHGTTQDGFAKPDLIVPGANIIAAMASDDSNLVMDHPSHKVSNSNGGRYFRMSGTSMASAVTAGAVALLLQDEPDLTPDQVKYRLDTTAIAFLNSKYLNIYAATHGATTASANTGIQASALLWTGSEPVTWSSVSWNSVSWNSVSWNSVSWNSVSWNSVSWNSVHWDD